MLRNRVVVAASVAWITACGATTSTSATSNDVDRTAAVRAAVILASCTVEMPAEYQLEEMRTRIFPRGSPHEMAALVRCLDEHRHGCRAVEDCLAMTVIRAGDLTTCEDGIAQSSLGLATARVDCGRLGRTCAVFGAIAECIDSTAPACANEGGAHCEADTPVRCRGGHEQRGVACAALGLACRESGTLAYCAGVDGSCDEAAPLLAEYVKVRPEGCDGERLAACVGSGRASLDCAAPATCRVRGSDAYCGFAGDCAPGKAAAASCDGDAVLVCNGGRVDRVDCTALGFASCVAGVSIVGEPYAMCR